MGFEIPVDVGYPGHRKVADLKAKLRDPQADVWPMRLWFWAATNARDGVIRVTPSALEVALDWRGKRGKLIKTLLATGWLETHTRMGELRIHDWMEGVGRAIFLYECKKRKQREKYALTEGFPQSSGRIPPIREIREGEEIREIRDTKSGRDAGASAPPPSSASPSGDGVEPKIAAWELTLRARGVTGSAAQFREQLGSLVLEHGVAKVQDFITKAQPDDVLDLRKQMRNGKAKEIKRTPLCPQCNLSASVRGGVERDGQRVPCDHEFHGSTR